MTWALVFFGTCLPMEEIAAGTADVDLELVLAVDVSGSMSKVELHVQREGYIAALRSDEVGAAIAFRGGIALAYMEWAGPDEQRVVVPWTVVSDATDAARFADRIASVPLNPGFESTPWGSGTSISRALLFAADMFTTHGAIHTIDISGNGPNNAGGLLTPVRERVIARGITVNSLAIVKRSTGFPIARYYEDCVIGGDGAFALAVDDPEEFASTLRRKMAQEIASIQAQFTLVGFEPTREPRIECP